MAELFRNATTMKEINELTIKFLKGELDETCYHCGPIDEETYEIRDKLIKINELLCGATTNSQPGIKPEEIDDNPYNWEQRCYISLVIHRKFLTKFTKELYSRMPECWIHIMHNRYKNEEHEIVSRYYEDGKIVNNTNTYADTNLTYFEDLNDEVLEDLRSKYFGICINDSVWGRKDLLLDKIIETLEVIKDD